MNNQAILLTLLLCLPGSGILAQLAFGADPLPASTEVRSDTLSNGLVYYILPNALPDNRAELRMVVRAGSLQETDRQLGVAHFVEHLAFNGTRHFAKSELIDFMEQSGSRFGADVNASTGFDRTIYELTVRTDSQEVLETGLLVLEDWADGVLFDSVEIEKERGVVIAEWRSRLGYQERLQRQTFPHLFEGSRYAVRLPIGSPELIDTVDRATLLDYYQTWYRPELMAVVAVGDFDPAWMEAEIRRRFARLSNRPDAPFPQSYRLDSADRELVLYATDPEAPYTRFQAAYELEDAQEVRNWSDFREALIIRLYNTLLNRRFVSLLEQDNPPFTFAGASYRQSLGKRRVFEFNILTGPEQLPEALQAVTTEIGRAEQHGFLPAELDRAKRELLEDYEREVRELDRRRSGPLASELIGAYLRESEPLDIERLTEQLPQVLERIELTDIQSMTDQFRQSRRRSFLVTGPDSDRDAFPDSSLLVARIDSMLDQSQEPYREKAIGEQIPVPELTPVGFALVREDTILGLREFQLENGIRMVLYPTEHQKDRILVSAFRPGGNSSYPDSLYATFSEMMTVASLSGLDTFSMADLNILLSGKDISVELGIGELYDLVSGNTAQRDLEDFFRLLYLKFSATVFDSTALRSYQRRMQAVLENRADNPLFQFAQFMRRLRYDDHPRRRIRDREDFERIDLGAARRIFTERFGDASDFVFLFVGNIPEARLLELGQTYLGNLPVSDRENAWKDVGAPLHAGSLDTTFLGGQTPRAQVHIDWHAAFPYQDRQQRYAFASLVELLRLRLREVLREEAGGVYGVSVRGSTWKEPSANYRIQLSFSANPEDIPTLLEQMDSTLQQLTVADQIDSVDIAKIQATQLQSYQDGRQRNGYWLGQLRARYQLGLPLSGLYPEAFPSMVETLDRNLLAEAAGRYINKGTRLQFIQLPEQSDSN